MSTRDRSPVRTSSPRHPSGKDPWNQWTTYTLALLELEQTTGSSGRRGTGLLTEPGFSQGFLGDLAWSSRLRAIDGCFVFLPFPNTHQSFHTSGCLLLTKLLVQNGQKPIPALCRSTILSLMSFDSSLVLPMVVERLEWKIASVSKQTVMY